MDTEPTGGPLFDRRRLYLGQLHTDLGEGGQFTMVPEVHQIKNPNKVTPSTITVRDIYDSVLIGILQAKRGTLSASRIETSAELWTQLDKDPDFDPVAAAQNATCEVEKRLGIYPNVPALESNIYDPKNEISNHFDPKD